MHATVEAALPPTRIACVKSLRDKSGVSMGPISLSFDGSETEGDLKDDELKAMVQGEKPEYKSISGMSTAEWRAKYEPAGAVDLWVEEEFNSGSRLVVRPGLAHGDAPGAAMHVCASGRHSALPE